MFYGPHHAILGIVYLLSLSACVGAIGDNSEEPNGFRPAESTRGGGSSRPGGSTEVRPAGASGRTGDAVPAPGGTDQPAVAGLVFACNAAAAPAPDTGMARLTGIQYRNTVRDAITAIASDGAMATAILGEVGRALATIPEDLRTAPTSDAHGGFRRLDQVLVDAEVAGYYAVAAAVGQALTAPARLKALLPGCASRPCVIDFLKKVTALVLRRPPSQDDEAFYTGNYTTTGAVDPPALADALTILFAAPQFLYLPTGSGAAVAGKANTFALDPFELATRLSYQAWQTMPDAALMAAAGDRSLATADGFARHLDLMLADPRARATLDEFFTDWLRLADIPALETRNTDPAFKAFAAADLPNPNLRAAMIEDALGLLRYYTFDAAAGSGGIDDVLTTNLSFARRPELAKVYGVAAWDGAGPPPLFPAGQRPGLATRAASLFPLPSARTRPIMRGVYVRSVFLCDTIPPPPPDAMAMANAEATKLDPSMSTRQITETITQAPGSSCVGCHGGLINPIGFALEAYDSLGRSRVDERIFNDTSGKELGKRPIDSRSVPALASGDTTPSNGPADLVTQIVASGKPAACLARQYFRFSFQRWEDPAVDGCALERLRAALQGKRSLLALFREAALLPEFQRRTFQ